MKTLKFKILILFTLLTLTASAHIQQVSDQNDEHFGEHRHVRAPGPSPLQLFYNDLSHLTRVINAISLQQMINSKTDKMREIGAELLGVRREEYDTLMKTDVPAVKTVLETISNPSTATRPGTISNVHEKKKALQFLIDSVAKLPRLKTVKILDTFSRIKNIIDNNKWEFSVTTFYLIAAYNVTEGTATGTKGEQQSILITAIALLDDLESCIDELPTLISKLETDIPTTMNALDVILESTEILEQFQANFTALNSFPAFFTKLKTEFSSSNNFHKLLSFKQSTDLKIVNNSRSSRHSEEQVAKYTAGLPRGYSDLDEIFKDINSDWFVKNVAGGNKENAQIVEEGLKSFKGFIEQMTTLHGAWTQFSGHTATFANTFASHFRQMGDVKVDLAFGSSIDTYSADLKGCMAKSPSDFGSLDLSELRAINQKLRMFKDDGNKLLTHLKSLNSTVNVALLKDFFKNLKGYTVVKDDLQQNINNIKALANFDAFQAAGPFFATERNIVSNIWQILAPNDTMPNLAPIMDNSKVLEVIDCLSAKNFDSQAVLNAILLIDAARGFMLFGNNTSDFDNYLGAVDTFQKSGKVFEQSATSQSRRRRSSSSSVLNLKNHVSVSQSLGSGLQTLHHMNMAFKQQFYIKNVMNLNNTVHSDIVTLAEATGQSTEDSSVANFFQDPNTKFGEILTQLDGLQRFAKTSKSDLASAGKLFEEASKIPGFGGRKNALVAIEKELIQQGLTNEAQALEQLNSLDLNFASGNLSSAASNLNGVKVFFDELFVQPTSQQQQSYPEPATSFGLILLFVPVLLILLLVVCVGFGFTKKGQKKYTDIVFYWTQDKKMYAKMNRYAYFTNHDKTSDSTILVEKCKLNQDQEVAKLLEQGAAVNAYNLSGNTALHEATLAGHPKLVELLIKNGADRSLKNAEGKTPLQMIPPVPDQKNLQDFQEIQKIYGKFEKKKCRMHLPMEFKTSQFRVHICKETGIEEEKVNAFNEIFKDNVPKDDDYVSHVVCKTDKNGVLETNDLTVLSRIIDGSIFVREEWLLGCLKKKKVMANDSQYLIRDVLFNGKLYKNCIPEWSKSRANFEIPYLAGAEVAIESRSEVFPSFRLQTLGAVVLSPKSDNQTRNIHPYHHKNLPAVLIITDDPSAHARQKDQSCYLFSPSDFFSFLLTKMVTEEKELVSMVQSGTKTSTVSTSVSKESGEGASSEGTKGVSGASQESAAKEKESNKLEEAKPKTKTAAESKVPENSKDPKPANPPKPTTTAAPIPKKKQASPPPPSTIMSESDFL